MVAIVGYMTKLEKKNPWQELIKTICFVAFRKKSKTHVELIVDNDFVKNFEITYYNFYNHLIYTCTN